MEISCAFRQRSQPVDSRIDMTTVLHIGSDIGQDSRFHRQELIGWWDQSLLARTRVLLIGAGALGNEILKNLALVGIGEVVVVDMDVIEYSNLARSVLFREGDIGKAKAKVACAGAQSIFPEILTTALVSNILHDLGLGVFLWADVVVCGLDNREARVAVNRACALTGTPWIDGAIEGLDGVFRVFLSDEAACYECTMNEVDWQTLEARRSCALLNREEMEAGKTPTTATTSSIVAGFQCQELLKIVHGLPVEGGTGIVINGQFNQVYRVTYPRKDDCLSHDHLDGFVDLGSASHEVAIGEVLRRAEEELGPGTTLELSREIIQHLECPACSSVERIFRPLGCVGMDQAICPRCSTQRYPVLIHNVDSSWEHMEMTPAELGLPPLDILIARNRETSRGFVLDGDREQGLGCLAGSWRTS